MKVAGATALSAGMGDASRMKYHNINHISMIAGIFLALAAFLPCHVEAAEITGKGFPLRSSPTAATPYAAPVNVVPYAQASAQPVAQPYVQTNVKTSAAPAPEAPALSTTAAFEGAPLAFSGNERRRQQRSGEQKSFSMPSIWPALFAVTVVCGLFIAALFFMKKYMPGHRQLFNHPAMELLGRTHLDQRRFVTLLRVGRRLVVVGVCSEEMRTLAEITDEAEITEIMEVARPKTEVGLTIFQKLFQRNVIEAEAEETRALAREKVEELDAQMSALRERVKEIRTDETIQEHQHQAERQKTRRTRTLDTVG